MDIKGISGVSPKGNEEHVVGNWREGSLRHTAIENLAESWHTVAWKIELISEKTGSLAKEVSEYSIEGMAWFLLATCSKMWVEWDKLLKKMEPALDNLGGSCSI